MMVMYLTHVYARAGMRTDGDVLMLNPSQHGGAGRPMLQLRRVAVTLVPGNGCSISLRGHRQQTGSCT